jgi:hypothetical protein
MISRTVRRVSLLGFLTVGAALAAWGGGAAAAAKHARAKAPDCKKDEDCVTVVDDCCSCSEGGRQRAIPKKDQAAYEKDRHKRCAGTACTEVMSQDPTCSQKPFCAAGICELGAAP